MSGALLTYTLTFGNGGADGVPAALNATVPSGTTFVSATGAGLLSGSVVQWNLGTLAPGFSDRRQMTVKVADSAVIGSLLLAQGQLLNSSSQQSLVRELTTNLAAASSLLSLSIVGSPDPITPGGTIVYRVLLSNSSTNTATGSFEVNVTVAGSAAPYSGTYRSIPAGAQLANSLPSSTIR